MAINRGGRARTDANQHAIVKAMRDAGIRVQILSGVGKGCPDILAGFRGINVLVELKNGERECDRKLTLDEQTWHAIWTGQCAIASTVEEAVSAVLAHAKAMGRL